MVRGGCRQAEDVLSKSTKAREEHDTASGEFLQSLSHNDEDFSPQVFNGAHPELPSDFMPAGLSISRVSSLHYWTHGMFVLVWSGFLF